MPNRPKPPRIVHLLGGLRAIDTGADRVVVQITSDQRLFEFATPDYPQLYPALRSWNLTPVGVEFPHPLTLEGRMAPDWECFFPGGGFRLMKERQSWSDIRNLASHQGDGLVVKIASKCVTYLDLLDIRLFQLSIGCNHALRAHWADAKNSGQLFSNTYMREIDAAIHAFVADAASFRDLISEIVWRLVLQEQGPVTRFSSFLKKAKFHPHELAVELVRAGKEGGWLHVFTELRNEIAHVAPVGRSHAFHFCQMREIVCGQSAKAPGLHYPILGADRKVWSSSADSLKFTSDNENAIKAALAEYREYLAGSIDGLTYAWQMLDDLSELLGRVREATGLKGETPHITDADIMGLSGISCVGGHNG